MHGSAFLLELGGVILLLAVLARVAKTFGFSPESLGLIAGLAFGQGKIVPLVTADRFIAAGAEIGLILLLFSLGLEYSARELVDAVRTSSRVGAMRGLVVPPSAVEAASATGGALIARGEFSIVIAGIAVAGGARTRSSGRSRPATSSCSRCVDRSWLASPTGPAPRSASLGR